MGVAGMLMVYRLPPHTSKRNRSKRMPHEAFEEEAEA